MTDHPLRPEGESISGAFKSQGLSWEDSLKVVEKIAETVHPSFRDRWCGPGIILRSADLQDYLDLKPPA